ARAARRSAPPSWRAPRPSRGGVVMEPPCLMPLDDEDRPIPTRLSLPATSWGLFHGHRSVPGAGDLVQVVAGELATHEIPIEALTPSRASAPRSDTQLSR